MLRFILFIEDERCNLYILQVGLKISELCNERSHEICELIPSFVDPRFLLLSIKDSGPFHHNGLYLFGLTENRS